MAETEAATAVASRDLGGKYLTFRLAEEEYGLEILKVREMRKSTAWRSSRCARSWG